jgi:hypothetical protein
MPLMLCGAGALRDAIVDSGRRRWLRVTVLGLLVACGVVHLPRFAATAAFHGGADTPPLFRFSALEADALASAIRREGGSALVDTDGSAHFSIFLMVELGRRGIPLQWTERSWKRILGYRPWPVPTYAVPAPLRIVIRTGATGEAGGPVIMRTTQYELRARP